MSYRNHICIIITMVLGLLSYQLVGQSLILNETFGQFTQSSASYNAETVTLPSGIGYLQCRELVETSGTCSPNGLTLKKNAQGTQGTVLLPLLESVGGFTVYMRSRSSAAKRLVNLERKEHDGTWTLLASNEFDGVCAAWSPAAALSVTPVSYRLVCMATDGDVSLYGIEVASAGGVSSQKEINYFSLLGVVGQISSGAESGVISLAVPFGSVLTAIVPDSVGISFKATLSPASTQAHDFSKPVSYVVTAEDGTTKAFAVQVNVLPASNANQILSFQLAGRSGSINHSTGNITVKIAKGEPVKNIQPVIIVSPYASISPSPVSPQDFSVPVTYTVTAQNGSTKTYTVVVEELSVAFVPDWSKPVGFASVSGDGFQGAVTGGGNWHVSDNVVEINGAAEFEKLVVLLYERIKAYKNQRDNGAVKYAPLTIVLKAGVYPEAGPVSNAGSVWGNSMLSVEEQGDLTIIGQGDVVLNFGINIKRSWNILIRNITFQDYYDDGVNIGGSETHHIWVDHCTFGHPTTMPANTEHPDGGCDVKDGASYVTISWCLFRNSWKTGLVGHSDSNGSTDTGRLKVTFFGNYYTGTNSRHPRVRFGEVHVLNNYYENVNLYGIAAANSANVFAEANFFKNTRFPMYADRSKSDFASVFSPLESYTGNYPAFGLKQVNNQFDDTGLPVLGASFVKSDMLNPGGRSIRFDEFNAENVFNPLFYYQYEALDASVLPELVPLFAGAGKVDFFMGNSSAQLPQNNGLNHQLQVYPNPVSTNGTMQLNGAGSLHLYNMAGQLVYRTTLDKKFQPVPLSHLNLKAGFYSIVLTSNTVKQTCKLIVKE